MFVHRQLDGGGEPAHATAGERVGNLEFRQGNTGFLEFDFSKTPVWNSAAEKSVAGHENSLILHATADERSGVIGLLEVPESGPDGDVRSGRASTAGDSEGITGLL